MTYYSGKALRVFVAGYEISAYVTGAEPIKAFDPVEFLIGYPLYARAYLAGLENSRMSLDGHWSSTTGMTHDRFNALAADQVISVFPRGNAAGGAAFGLTAHVIEHALGAPVDDRLSIRAGLPPTTASKLHVGRCLCIQETITEDGSSASVDFGAAGTLGGGATLQIYGVSASDTISVIIEHSTTDAWEGEETTLATFSSTGATVAGEMETITGAIKRYARATWDVTGTDVDFDIAVMLAINKN